MQIQFTGIEWTSELNFRSRTGLGHQEGVAGAVVFIGFGIGCPPFALRSEDLEAERGGLPLRVFFVGVVGASAGSGFSEPSSSYQTSTVKS